MPIPITFLHLPVALCTQQYCFLGHPVLREAAKGCVNYAYAQEPVPALTSHPIYSVTVFHQEEKQFVFCAFWCLFWRPVAPCGALETCFRNCNYMYLGAQGAPGHPKRHKKGTKDTKDKLFLLPDVPSRSGPIRGCQLGIPMPRDQSLYLSVTLNFR